MTINLRQALEVLQSGNWCSLRFITANVNKKSGGKVMELARCRIARNRPTQSNISNEATTSTLASEKKKDPNHNLHFTRNVELQNRTFIKVHPILITHINNQQVV